jgi:hypothetical protein
MNVSARDQCTANLNIPASKISALFIIRNNRNSDFHENGSDSFDSFQVSVGPTFLRKSAEAVSSAK